MVDFVLSQSTLKTVEVHAALMDRMVAVVGADLLEVASSEDGGWCSARFRCLGCQSVSVCNSWLEMCGAAGTREPPDFCPNGPIFRESRPKSPH